MSIALASFVVLTIAGALLSVTLRNILHAIFGLGVSLLGVAGMFLYLGSPFLAAMEVLIYVGGISVAMVFAVMLSQALGTRDIPHEPGRMVAAAIPSFGLFGVLAWIIHGATFPGSPNREPAAWSPAAMGHALLTDFNLVFETLSIVLLLAIAGAILIAKREERT